MVLRREMLKDTLRLLRVTAVISTNSHREVFYYSWRLCVKKIKKRTLRIITTLWKLPEKKAIPFFHACRLWKQNSRNPEFSGGMFAKTTESYDLFCLQAWAGLSCTLHRKCFIAVTGQRYCANSGDVSLKDQNEENLNNPAIFFNLWKCVLLLWIYLHGFMYQRRRNVSSFATFACQFI